MIHSSTFVFMPEGFKADTQTDVCTSLFAALFTTATVDAWQAVIEGWTDRKCAS